MRFLSALVATVFSSATFSTAALAQEVTINLTPDAKQVLGNQLQVAEDQLEGLVQERFQEIYRLLEVDEFLRVSANAQALSNKGIGVDYAASPKFAIFGAAIAVSADAGDADLKTIAEPDAAFRAGAGAQLALMGGLNLAIVGLPNVMVFANGLYYPLTVGELDGEFFNLGGHIQVALVSPKGVLPLEWSGIRLTSGIEVSRMVLELENEQKSSAPVKIADRSYEIRSTATGILRLEQTAFNIPIEATTGISIFSIVSIYGGIGIDFMFGGAKIDAELDATMEADDPRDANQTLDVGTAQVVASEEGQPSTVFPRFLVGAQVHVGPLNVFGQLNLGFNDVAVSVAAGLRLSI